MLFTGSIVAVGDNSGARTVRCLKVVSRSKYRWAQLGDVVLVVPRRLRPHKKVRRKEKHRFLLVNTRRGLQRAGQKVLFGTNAGIILKRDDAVPLASRIRLMAPFELRRSFRRVVTMAASNL